MAWAIETSETKKQKEAEDRERLGDEMYAERIRVAGEKADELDWKEAMFAKPQFENIALAAGDKIWPSLRDERDGQFWWKLLAKIVSK